MMIAEYEKHIKLINNVLDSTFTDNNVLFKITKGFIHSGGKRIRPLLALLSCEAICGDSSPALSIAVSYELGHLASLVQDDIIDKIKIRRGKESVCSKYGIDTAILVSDTLVFQIFKEMSKMKLSEGKISRILDAIGSSAMGVTLGKFRDISFIDNKCESEKDYISMIKLKTGMLIASPIICGAIVAGASKNELETMKKFGESIGIAFQIFDDFLDITGNPKKMGKPIFADIKNNKNNFVIIHALNSSNSKECSIIRSFHGKELSQEEMLQLKKILAKSIDYTHKKALEYVKIGIRFLNGIEDSEAKEKLIKLSRIVVERNF